MGHGSRTTQLIPFSVLKKQNYCTRCWALLSSSPGTVISLFLSVVDHVDNNGGRRRGERTKAEDDGEASDGNEQEPGKIIASRGRREQAVPPVLVWLWRLEEEETEETRQTLNVNPTVKVGTIVC